MSEPLQRLQEQVSAEATARASMDEDLRVIQRKLDAQLGLISALRENQIDHGHRLTRIDSRLDRIDGQLEMTSGTVRQLASDMDVVKTGIGHLTTLVEQLIERGR